MSVARQIQNIRDAVQAACRAAARDPATVRLAAVSKTKPADVIQAALDVGQRLFAENRVQEAALKFPPLKAKYPDLRLHLIGPLQTNKVKQAFDVFDGIEVLDRASLALAIAKEAQKRGCCPDLFIEVNSGGEPQKAGILLPEAPAFINYCRRDLSLPVTGLMTIPPQGQDPIPYFERVAALAAEHELKNISMGMSGDFVAAIACGATEVRIGSAIFGAR